MKQSGLICNIFKSGDGDFSNGGISSKNKRILLVLPNGGPFDTDDAERLGLPVCKVVTRTIAGNLYNHVEPIEPGMWANGGAIVHTSDSRFPNDYPMTLHDRDLSSEV